MDGTEQLYIHNKKKGGGNRKMGKEYEQGIQRKEYSQ